MEILSDRLTRELMDRGNLPISAEGVVRLRPDIADEFSVAQSLLAVEIEDRSGDGEDVDAGSCEGLLEARFVASTGSTEQRHLFMLASAGAEGEDNRIQRWSKMPVSYGSLVQVKKFLSEAWGDIRGLELQRAQFRLSR